MFLLMNIYLIFSQFINDIIYKKGLSLYFARVFFYKTRAKKTITAGKIPTYCRFLGFALLVFSENLLLNLIIHSFENKAFIIF